MRMVEIAVFCIMLQAGVGFVNELGIFDNQFIPTQNNTYTRYTVQDLDEYSSMMDSPGLFDYASMLGSFLWEGFTIIIKIISSIVFILPLLISMFHIPLSISSFIQLAVWVVYSLGIAEWKSGKPLIGT